MSDLEIWLITTVAGLSIAVIGFLIKDKWERAKHNQDRIDKSVVDTVQDNKDKIAVLDKALALLSAKVHGNTEDIEELFVSQKVSNDNANRLIETINKLDANSKLQHQESTTLAREMKLSMDNNTKVIHDLLNSLKK